jgi:YD repeat-containing protein
MRAPIRSESDAFRLTLGSTLLVVVSFVVGSLTVPLAGVAVFALASVLTAMAYLRSAGSDPAPVLREAAQATHPTRAIPGERHVLVVANEALSGTELRERILRHGRHVELDVLAPVLTSHIHYGVSDIDRELEDARERLARSLAWARTLNIAVRGEVGDPSPITAVEDELRDFGADEVIVVTHPRHRQTWQERDQLERLQRELEVPVTHVPVGEAGGLG